MRKRAAMIGWMIVVLAVGLITGCKKGSGVEKSLGVLPGDAKAVFALDVRQMADLNTFKKMNEEKFSSTSPFKDYNDFVARTGIDVNKNVNQVVGAIYTLESKDADILVAIDLTYDKDRLLKVLKEVGAIENEEVYNGLTVYQGKLKKETPDLSSASPSIPESGSFAFLNANTILLGSTSRIKAAIDLKAGKGKSVAQDEGMRKYIGEIEKGSMGWAVVLLPENVKQTPPQGPLAGLDLKKAEAFIVQGSYRNKIVSLQMSLINRNEQANNQIVTMLNGFKALIAMGAEKEPEIKDLINNIQLTAAADRVKLALSLTDSQLAKLEELQKKKAAAAVPPAAESEAAPTESQEETPETGDSGN